MTEHPTGRKDGHDTDPVSSLDRAAAPPPYRSGRRWVPICVFALLGAGASSADVVVTRIEDSNRIPARIQEGATQGMGEDTTTATAVQDSAGQDPAPTDADPSTAPAAGPASAPAAIPATAPTPARERAAARLLRSAIRAESHGDPARAARLAERARHFYPATPSGGQAALLLRELWLAQGRELDADGITGLPDRPDTAAIPRDTFLRLVRSHLERSNLIEADRLVAQWAPCYPSEETAALRLSLGGLLLRSGKQELARRHLEAIPPGDPREAEALLLLARSYDGEADKARALELYRRVAILPDCDASERGLIRVADLEFQSGSVREALASYAKALDAGIPRDEEAWVVYQLGNCHLVVGDAGSARVEYETVSDRWPQSPWALAARDRLEELRWREQLSAKVGAQAAP